MYTFRGTPPPNSIPSGQKEIATLIVTRSPGETLIIETPTGEQITVTVLQVKGNQESADVTILQK